MKKLLIYYNPKNNCYKYKIIDTLFDINKKNINYYSLYGAKLINIINLDELFKQSKAIIHNNEKKRISIKYGFEKKEKIDTRKECFKFYSRKLITYYNTKNNYYRYKAVWYTTAREKEICSYNQYNEIVINIIDIESKYCNSVIKKIRNYQVVPRKKLKVEIS